MGVQPSPTTRALTSIEAILDGLDATQVARGERLDRAQQARGLASRLTALAAVLLAQADATQESLRDTGTPTTTWLATRGGLSKREAAGLLHQARDLAEHPAVAEAAASGRISVGQARSIDSVLGSLGGLDNGQLGEAEQILLGLAASTDSDRLAKAAPQVLAQVAPQQADEAQERRLQRQAEAAQRNRSLVFGRDGNGSVTFSGSLPIVDGEAWLTILDAYTESRRRSAIEERDPLATSSTPAQRRADALLAMIHEHQHERRAPKVGGDRPRVIVTLDYDKLRRQAAGAGLVGDEPISAGDLRRLCCDAGLLPAVLGGPSEVLEVGRAARLVTAEIRAALVLRDGGCAFPSCQSRASACEAHHIVPWWAGGETSLENLVLLCHHHHALVEPARFGARDQWEVRIAEDGPPEFTPPRRYDARRRPLRHARFRGGAEARPPDDRAEEGPPGA